MKLWKLGIFVVVLFVGLEVGTPYISDFVIKSVGFVNDSLNKNENEEVLDTEFDESEAVSAVVSESRLKTLLTYLPFLGINIRDVEEIEEPKMTSSEALSFTYNSNCFALYQVDVANTDVSTVVSALKENNIVEIDGVSYVGYVASDLVVLIEEVKDLPKLIESVREVNSVLSSLGFEKVSLKFE